MQPLTLSRISTTLLFLVIITSCTSRNNHHSESAATGDLRNIISLSIDGNSYADTLEIIKQGGGTIVATDDEPQSDDRRDITPNAQEDISVAPQLSPINHFQQKTIARNSTNTACRIEKHKDFCILSLTWDLPHAQFPFQIQLSDLVGPTSGIGTFWTNRSDTNNKFYWATSEKTLTSFVVDSVKIYVSENTPQHLAATFKLWLYGVDGQKIVMGKLSWESVIWE